MFGTFWPRAASERVARGEQWTGADGPPPSHGHRTCRCSSQTTWDWTHLQPIKTSKSQREAVTPLQHTHTHTHTHTRLQSCEPSSPERLKITFVSCVRILWGRRVVKSADHMSARILWKREKTSDKYFSTEHESCLQSVVTLISINEASEQQFFKLSDGSCFR